MSRNLAVVLLAGLFALVVSGCSDGASPEGSSGSTRAERTIKYWVAPMDPTFISDRPGKSPMGMDLVPVYEDEAGGASGDSDGLRIDPVVVQNMGVRIAPVQRQPIFRHLRTIGEVEVAEDEVSVVNLRVSGWVEKLYADRTGDPVEAGAPLFDIYSPDLVAAQEEFLLAIRTQGRDSELARSTERKLELWNVRRSDIDRIARERKVRRVLPIRSPRSGFILNKSIVEGARVMAGKDLYQIGDLSRIWVTAEVYEYDAPWVELGQPAQMELTYEPGAVVEGKVSYVYPTLDKSSRTLTVRLEFENPDYRLKPGMFATVYIQFRRKDDALVIPTEAILKSGTRQLVFVTPDNGHFEPREITTGLVGDRHETEVLSGLQAGELVVVSGQFLVDSESQLQEAIHKMLERRNGTAGAKAKSGDAVANAVWSCPMHTEFVSDEPGRCPICGMELAERPGTPEELRKLHGTPDDPTTAPPTHPEDSTDPHSHDTAEGRR